MTSPAACARCCPTRRSCSRGPPAPGTRPSTRPAACWSPPARSIRRTSSRCTSASKSVSTYVGNSLAIPHGTNEAKESIRATGLSFIRYSNGIDWNGDGELARFVVGIAGAGNDHLALLGSIAHVFLDDEKVAALTAATTKSDVAAVLGNVL